MSDQREEALRAIDTKWRALGAEWGDLGPSTEAPRAVEGGGWYQRFMHGRIYWHPASGAHGLGGDMLRTYLSRGGADVNPASGCRELGFPISDEIRSDTGRYSVNYFEHGAIFGINGGVALFGMLYGDWRGQGGERSRLGYPIQDPVRVDGCDVAFFQSGCLARWPGLEQPIVAILQAPPIGRPGVVDPRQARKLPITVAVAPEALAAPEGLAARLADVWRDRLVLQATGRATEQVRLDVEVRHEGARHTRGRPETLRLVCVLPASHALHDFMLYDVGFRLEDGTIYTMAPHAIYARASGEQLELVGRGDCSVGRLIDGQAAQATEQAAAETADPMPGRIETPRDQHGLAGGPGDRAPRGCGERAWSDVPAACSSLGQAIEATAAPAVVMGLDADARCGEAGPAEETTSLPATETSQVAGGAAMWTIPTGWTLNADRMIGPRALMC